MRRDFRAPIALLKTLECIGQNHEPITDGVKGNRAEK